MTPRASIIREQNVFRKERGTVDWRANDKQPKIRAALKLSVSRDSRRSRLAETAQIWLEGRNQQQRGQKKDSSSGGGECFTENVIRWTDVSVEK